MRNGYEVIARNWSCPRGELDVVVWRAGVLVVCEVKARRNDNFGGAFEAVTPRKMLRIRRAAASFIAALRVSADSPNIDELRFDVAAVTGGRFEIRENVG